MNRRVAVAICVSAIVTMGCDNNNLSPNNAGLEGSVGSRSANIAVVGLEGTGSTTRELILDGGSAAFAVESIELEYSGFGLDAGDLQILAQENGADPLASIGDILQAISDAQFAGIRDVLLDTLGATRVDVLRDQASSNSLSTVILKELDIVFAGGVDLVAVRNIVLKALSRATDVNAISVVSTTKNRYRATLATWASEDRVLSWSGTFGTENADDVMATFGKLNNGTNVLDSKVTRLESDSDTFVQPEGNTVADILWVIDNSGSMSEEQGNLAAGAQLFFERLQLSNLDFHLGVVRTGQERELGECWELSTLSDGTRFVRSTTPAREAEWDAISQPGTRGSGTETGLFCAQQVFLDPTGVNVGFDRPNAPNVLVIVSDEPDAETFNGSTPSGRLQADPSYALQDLDDYLNYFTSNDMAVFGLIGTADTPRNRLSGQRITGPNFSCSGDGGSAVGGANYSAVIQATGGSRSSICSAFDTWATTFDGVVEAASGRSALFQLMRIPVDKSVRVFIDGVEAMRDFRRRNGYDVIYDESGASIVFFGQSVPASGSTVQVDYGVPVKS